MGALAAVVGKRCTNISDVLILMLQTLEHRGVSACAVAMPDQITMKENLQQLKQESIEASALIGQNSYDILPTDEAQLILENNFSFALEGRLFPTISRSELESIIQDLEHNRDKSTHLIRELSGDYVFAINEKNGVVVGRDPIGSCPLYFGENKSFSAVASERKALWRIGITQTYPFPPGKSATITQKGFHFKNAKAIKQPCLQKITMKTAVEKLKSTLYHSTMERVSDVENTAIAFSGGIDSSIIAYLAMQSDSDPHLIYVSMENQEETAFVKRAANALRLPLSFAEYSIEDLEIDLPKVLWLIEDSSPLQASIAAPLFWAAEQTAKLGFHVLMTGQGADELFGGYHIYLKEYAKHGHDGLQKKIFTDLISSHERNMQRDNKVCAFNKIELRMPFVDWETIHLALSLPTKLKIRSTVDPLRKRILRRLAREIGVPRFIAEKKKRAIQYTTGVNKALKKLAKKRRLTLRRYLHGILGEVYSRTKGECLEQR
ncbi:MAG: hypothetical protein JSV64_05010 [Candidatus Bathyarchaeota archaeon]|nr:MAG: hypothetical protein JSV64_05010 [Candidatus Bathyarchaeota archaeon]